MRHVSRACVEERLRLGRVDEVAREQHAVERPPEVELLDPRVHRLRAPNVLEHLRRLVDSRDTEAARDELVRDAAGAAAELEDACAAGSAAAISSASAAPGSAR